MADTCRCGAPKTADPHPCHGFLYACRKPAERRFYNPYFASLAGVQMKIVMSETWACDECWARFQVDPFPKTPEAAP